MARLGLLKFNESPGYTEYTDMGGCGFIGRTYKGRMAAGANICVVPGVGTVAQMLTRTDLLGWPGAKFITTDANYSRIEWTPNVGGTAWRPVNGQALLQADQGSIGIPLLSLAATGTFTAQPVFLANLLQPKTAVRIRMHLRKKGAAGVATLNLYMGTAGTTGDSLVYTLPIAATTNRDIWVDTLVGVFNTTTLIPRGAMPDNADAGTFSAAGTTNVNTAAQMKLTVGGVLVSADSIDLYSYGIFIEAP